MKRRPQGIGNAIPQVLPQFPIQQVTVRDLIDRMDDQELSVPLSDTGPLALDADTAIRNVTADLLAAVKNRLKDAESDDHRELLAPHVADLEKLRTWLLGFQAKAWRRSRS